jgi:hypothetical protein
MLTGYWVVSFTCADCRLDCERFTRADPELVSRCHACENTAVRQVSERILTLVFGGAPES